MLDQNIPEARDLEVILDDSFSLSRYEVVRGEFFAHTYEPTFTINRGKVMLNNVCIRKLPNVSYVQILVNPTDRKLCVRPCYEEEKDAVRWCTDKRKPRQITAKLFTAKIMDLMDWNMDFRYKLLGKLIRSGSDILFVFDLTTPETFASFVNDEGKLSVRRKPVYPEEWQHRFGIPVEEHRKRLQVNRFSDHVTFRLETDVKEENEDDTYNSDRSRQDEDQDTQSDASHAGGSGVYPTPGES